MTEISEGISAALADRYGIQRELDQGGMAYSRQPAAGSRQRLRGFFEQTVLHV